MRITWTGKKKKGGGEDQEKILSDLVRVSGLKNEFALSLLRQVSFSYENALAKFMQMKVIVPFSLFPPFSLLPSPFSLLPSPFPLKKQSYPIEQQRDSAPYVFLKNNQSVQMLRTFALNKCQKGETSRKGKGD